MKKAIWFSLILVFLSVYLLNGCNTGVEPSPDPGIIRITMKSAEVDTLLVILGDTVKFSRVDHYDVIFSQGRLYQGNNYADLFTDLSIDRINSDTINILQRAWLDGRLITPTDSVFDVEAFQSRYVSSKVIEWYVPPGAYDKLQFNFKGIEVFVARPRQFRTPLQLAEGVTPIMNFNQTITVNAGHVTEVNLEILPFQSIRRYKDSYIFDRKVSVASVRNY
ncbi:MAG: hypothetical protein KJ799_16910 [Bacteroidetes bacterium]|nr:hypothetical protein [Bacteroidota bacterium]MBU2508378.1 hypothetical protein [Bacteroidota bacterium]